jgi:hypothetical protein
LENLWDPASFPSFVKITTEASQAKEVLSPDDLRFYMDSWDLQSDIVIKKCHGKFYSLDPERWLFHLRSLKNLVVSSSSN